MKVPVAHLLMGNNQSANFQKNSCAHLLEHHQNHVHRRGTNRQTDIQTNRVKPILYLRGYNDKDKSYRPGRCITT